ncbi:MAG: Ig-like domain-containing protein [Candidatus Magasanikbacteria bacterium]|nr:Ig-like domain-containing protein [Candidatus Magasanikbacteria bacterium]
MKPKILWASTALVLCLGLQFFLFNAAPASAQNLADPNSELKQGLAVIQEPLGLGAGDIRLIVARIIRIALGLLGIVLLVLILYAGYLWMTAGGNEEKIAEAKKLITNAVIGLAIILSAYAIVGFIFKILGVGSGTGGGIGGPNTQNFSGSGALGGIVKDHYPYRDQKDVPRNTKIIITFRQPILLDSFVVDINKNGILGDCINVGPTMNWKTDCDALKNINDTHINVVNAAAGQSILGANILASYESVANATGTKVFTIVIRPYDYLGSSEEKIPYLVRLGKDIRLDDPANNNPSAFNKGALGNDFYQWKFTCSTELDTKPPIVNNTWPGAGATDYKNTVIQIDFSEAMDPTGIQGMFATSSNAFAVGTNNIAVKQSGNTTMPTGNFKITNGYRTLEFTPDKPCGTNACGGTIYCLPVCDVPNNTCNLDKNNHKQDLYEMLVKAGVPFNSNAFEAIPFSGVMDASGNGLDSKPFGQVNFATSALPIFPTWQVPDNYAWNFTIIDDIDLTPPYLQQIAPGLDAQFVAATDPWEMLFSKRLRVDPLYNIVVTEHPTPVERGDNIPLCKVPRASFRVNGTTVARMEHCPFLDGLRQYYFPIISSDIEDAHFNCFYPGLGPGGRPDKVGNHWTEQGAQSLRQSLVCDAENREECCAVTSTPESRSFCCNGLADPQIASSSPQCVSALITDSPL